MTDDTKTTAITQAMPTEIQRAQPQGLEALGSTDAIKAKLEDNLSKLEVVHEFIVEKFEKGRDYGVADDRNTKEVLLKPGAEKLCVMFGVRPVWHKDKDMWEMLGKPEGTVCLICELVDTKTGNVIGEGRGSDKKGNKQRDANKAIKIAEKCAMMDAVIYAFALSDRFTQDLKTRATLQDQKNAFVDWVTEKRAGCSSSMTTNRFIHEVIGDYLKKSAIQTQGELEAVKAVIESGAYDLESGERIPEN